MAIDLEGERCVIESSQPNHRRSSAREFKHSRKHTVFSRKGYECGSE